MFKHLGRLLLAPFLRARTSITIDLAALEAAADRRVAEAEYAARAALERQAEAMLHLRRAQLAMTDRAPPTIEAPTGLPAPKPTTGGPP